MWGRSTCQSPPTQAEGEEYLVGGLVVADCLAVLCLQPVEQVSDGLFGRPRDVSGLE